MGLQQQLFCGQRWIESLYLFWSWWNNASQHFRHTKTSAGQIGSCRTKAVWKRMDVLGTKVTHHMVIFLAQNPSAIFTPDWSTMVHPLTKCTILKVAQNWRMTSWHPMGLLKTSWHRSRQRGEKRTLKNFWSPVFTPRFTHDVRWKKPREISLIYSLKKRCVSLVFFFGFCSAFGKKEFWGQLILRGPLWSTFAPTSSPGCRFLSRRWSLQEKSPCSELP